MPRGRPKKVTHLQANDTMEYKPVVITEYLTDGQIEEASQPYKEKGVQVDLTETTWLLSLKKELRDIRGNLVKSGQVKVTGTRNMPIKDFLYSLRELMIPLAPITPNPAQV